MTNTIDNNRIDDSKVKVLYIHNFTNSIVVKARKKDILKHIDENDPYIYMYLNDGLASEVNQVFISIDKKMAVNSILKCIGDDEQVTVSIHKGLLFFMDNRKYE